MSITKDKVLYSRIRETNEACVGTEDGSKNAVSTDFVGEVIILSHVTIDNVYCTVTTICYRAFSYCYQVANIVIPNTVTLLRKSSFWNLNLTSPLIIPSSVTTVESFFINNWGPKAIIFCGTKEHLMIDTSTGNNGFISAKFTGKVSVPEDYEKDSFCLKSVEKKTLSDCSIIQTFLSIKLHRARTCLKQRQQVILSSLFYMMILLIY